MCMDRGVHISAAQVPGIHNTIAGSVSRNFNDASDWMLSKDISVFLADYFWDSRNSSIYHFIK